MPAACAARLARSERADPELVRHAGDHPLESAREQSGGDDEGEQGEKRQRHRPERGGDAAERVPGADRHDDENGGQHGEDGDADGELPARQVPPRHAEQCRDLRPRPDP